MKYLVAASGVSLDAKISKRFGHASFYLVVDPDTFEFETKTGARETEPSHGIGRFLDYDIKAVIVGNIGPGAFQDVSNAGWSVYSCLGLTVREAVEKVRNGLVPALTAPTMKRSIHAGHQGKEVESHTNSGHTKGHGHSHHKE